MARLVTAREAPVSVVIPVYNGEDYVGEALESVLRQTCPPAQVVVVDDGSTDETRHVLREFRNALHVVSQPNRGQAAALNAGVAVADQPYLTLCDADDRWVPDKVERQLRAFTSATPPCDAVFGHFREFTSGPPQALSGLRNPLEWAPGWSAGTMLIRRTAFDRVGPFDERFRSGEFIDWLDRARAQHLSLVMLDDVVLLRRIHGRNLTVDPEYPRHLLRVIRASVARRRLEASG